MPLIRRKRSYVAESLFGSAEHEHEFYVPARKVEKGDAIVPVDEIPDAMLADLAKSHPKEFGAAALERGVLELEDDEEEDDELPPVDDDDDQEFTEAQEAFQLAPAADAIALVKAAAKDPEQLALYAEAEQAKTKPRKTVLEALQAALDAE